MRSWSVYVEYDAQVPDDLHDAIADHLADEHGSVSTSQNGNLTIRVLVDALTISLAEHIALQRADHALHTAYGRAAVVGIEVMTEDELDRRNTEPLPLPDLAGLAEIQEITGVASRQHASQLTNTVLFQTHAQPVARLRAGPVYFAHQVRAFNTAWQEQKAKRAARNTDS